MEEKKQGAEESKDPEGEDGVGENLGDRTLLMTLEAAINANCRIDGLNDRLVNQLATQ